jgi:hypothetical protein
MIEIASGARVQIRDEEWLVRTADLCDVGGHELKCIGISETVRNREAIFLTAIDSVEVLDPNNTELVLDDSPRFVSSLLYLEARLRQTIPTSAEITLGHRGAMDALPFQLLPTKRALEQLRPRFLIADAVGLGKTLEAGVLVSELMRRGRGRLMRLRHASVSSVTKAPFSHRHRLRWRASSASASCNPARIAWRGPKGTEIAAKSVSEQARATRARHVSVGSLTAVTDLQTRPGVP